MRRGGLPCRQPGCERSFAVLDQSSMSSLQSASAERNAHEVAEHGYHHQAMPEERAYMPHLSIKTPRVGR